MRLTRVRGVPRADKALGFGVSFRQRLDVLACPRCGRRLTLIALIEDPAVIVRVLGHLGLPTDIPEARAPPLHLVGDAPPTAVAGSSTNPPAPACSTVTARRAPRRLESRLTAAPRTGILDTMCSVEACSPRVGGANPLVCPGSRASSGL